jgi:hypothetical protein
MRRDGSPRPAGRESALHLTARAGIAVVDVAVACLPYAAGAATAAGVRLWDGSGTVLRRSAHLRGVPHRS